MNRCAVSTSLNDYLDYQDSLEEPEAPALAHCDRCGKFLPRYASMPICMDCNRKALEALKAGIERQIQMETVHAETIAVLAANIKRRKVA